MWNYTKLAALEIGANEYAYWDGAAASGIRFPRIVNIRYADNGHFPRKYRKVMGDCSRIRGQPSSVNSRRLKTVLHSAAYLCQAEIK